MWQIVKQDRRRNWREERRVRSEVSYFCLLGKFYSFLLIVKTNTWRAGPRWMVSCLYLYSQFSCICSVQFMYIVPNHSVPAFPGHVTNNYIIHRIMCQTAAERPGGVVSTFPWCFFEIQLPTNTQLKPFPCLHKEQQSTVKFSSVSSGVAVESSHEFRLIEQQWQHCKDISQSFWGKLVLLTNQNLNFCLASKLRGFLCIVI